MNITIPFCYLPNSMAQVFDMTTCKRSVFQVDALKRVAERDDFAYFVTVVDVDQSYIMHPDYRGSVSVMWYDKAGQCHAARIGKRKFIVEWSKVGDQAGDPVPLDSAVYTSRCA